MASPISYESRDPRQVRAVLATIYEGYASGRDLFPRKRLAFPANRLGRKSIEHGLRLERAWKQIDNDRDYFRDTLMMMAALTAESGKRHMVL